MLIKTLNQLEEEKNNHATAQSFYPTNLNSRHSLSQPVDKRLPASITRQRIKIMLNSCWKTIRHIRFSNKRYAKGIDSFIGVLYAQRSLYAAQQRLISLRLAKLSNQVRLYAVLGGGSE